MIENKFHSTITIRGDVLIIKGDDNEVRTIDLIFVELEYMFKRNGSLDVNDISTVINLITPAPEHNQNNRTTQDNLIYRGVKDDIFARTGRQMEYYQKVQKNDLVFAIGPAGTGKTYLAVAIALALLKKNEMTKLILSRPAVEAGESLGFLPGDLQEKIDPYLRPLTDALYHMLSAEKFKSMVEKNIIEIIPLAYMRGRTLNNCIIILDEAQNATITQMKMFLTRLGANSKSIITGDITQVDLPDKDTSGLVHAQSILKNIPGIGYVYFDKTDVVRHRLVAEIIEAYEKEAKRKK